MMDRETIICRCEEVTYEELITTADSYHCSARELKLRTRAGMGICGGRTCRFLIEYAAEESKEKVYENIPLKYQPPVRPMRFDEGGKNK
ncbi:(2Fe-2S)-binding protein [Salibacterium aidingense]|uniref:(2Fe-2S)-binding protein n=1 Tax=Salibacterium aidingense TaxID=384933 RepID=UPI003BC425DF